jgi:hypothetical protein
MGLTTELAGKRRCLMSTWNTLDKLDRLFIIWSFLLQLLLIIHFALRKPFFESYTLRFGWIVYALCIPAAIISLLLLRGGKSWFFWLGGFLFVAFAIFGFWVDYVAKIQFRSPVRVDVLVPYILLYLSSIMFYWWPLLRLDRRLWFVYMILYVISTILNVTSH